MRHGTLNGCLVLFALVLSSCTQVQHLPEENASRQLAYEARRQQLEPAQDWSLSGKLAVSDGKDGGTGQLSWVHQGEVTRMSFRGTFGKGAWQLHSDHSKARLELADGSIHEAATISELVEIQVGWKVPVIALSSWIKGLAHPVDWESRELDQEGRLIKLDQLDWEVDFDNYQSVSGPWLPMKLTARKGGYRVKIVISEWKMGFDGEIFE